MRAGGFKSGTVWVSAHVRSEHFCQRKNIFPTGLGASPCTKPIWDSSESSSQAEPFITNRPCSLSTPNVHCHRVHSISYLRQQIQRCISFPIPGNRCRTSGLYNRNASGQSLSAIILQPQSLSAIDPLRASAIEARIT